MRVDSPRLDRRSVGLKTWDIFSKKVSSARHHRIAGDAAGSPHRPGHVYCRSAVSCSDWPAPNALGEQALEGSSKAEQAPVAQHLVKKREIEARCRIGVLNAAHVLVQQASSGRGMGVRTAAGVWGSL